MKNVIAAAQPSLVLSVLLMPTNKEMAMMKITPSTLADADFKRCRRRWRASAARPSSNDLWQRDALSAHGKPHRDHGDADCPQPAGELKHYIAVALDSGVTPAEVSEIITHLAFYAGWPNAVSRQRR
jgi:4-carboxymuconolactone decarboxylase